MCENVSVPPVSPDFDKISFTNNSLARENRFSRELREEEMKNIIIENSKNEYKKEDAEDKLLKVKAINMKGL